MVRRAVPVADLETAEAVELAEDAFRAVNIALANELKLVFGAMGINPWAVTEAAATKPFGYMPFWPGPGPGGHCIPVDPHYLAWRARERGAETPLIDLACAINDGMPRRVLRRLAEALAARAGPGRRPAPRPRTSTRWCPSCRACRSTLRSPGAGASLGRPRRCAASTRR